jgi:hypothetical protein
MKHLGTIILLGTLLVSIPRFAAAFAQAEPTFLGLTISPVTGLGFGLLIEGGIYFVFTAWLDASKRGLKRANWLLAGVLGQLSIGTFIIAPSLVGVLSNKTLAEVLAQSGLIWLWSLTTAIAPALLLATVAAASYMLQPASQRKPARTPVKRLPELENPRHYSILTIVQGEPNINRTQLAERLNVSRTTLYDDLKQLTASGHLSNDGRAMKVNLLPVLNEGSNGRNGRL